MGANRAIAVALTAALCVGTATADQTRGTVRHYRTTEPGISPVVAEAEAALDKKDYSAAEKLLNAATKADPKDARAWFDLGLVDSANNKKEGAIEAYRQSATLKPDFFEANLNLGLALAAAGKTADSVQYLRAATKLSPSDSGNAQSGKFIAWYALAKALEPNDSAGAADAYKHAAEIQPQNVDVHLGEARALEQLKDAAGAEKEFQAALAINPKSEDAARELANLYIENKQSAQAEEALRHYLELDPQGARAHLQLARVLASAGKHDEAAQELETAEELAPNDPAIRRELAGNAASAGKYEIAEQQYRTLVQENPRNAGLHYALGTVLMDQKKFAAAEPELIESVKLDPKIGEAYGNLATVAAENQHYPLALAALDARAKLLPENPGSYFLRASCLDHLKQYKKAAENYRMFLSVANGKFPDQEWQAKHRLLAIDPK